MAINPNPHRRTPWLLLAAAFCVITSCFGSKVPLKSAVASYAERPAEGLPAVIDGQDAGRIGWSVFPRVEEAQTLVIRSAKPVTAEAYGVTLCFLSGMPKRYFGKFALSCTTDANPTLEGNWQRLKPLRFSATGTTLSDSGDGFLVSGDVDNMIGDAVFQLRVQIPRLAVTGFRIEVMPFQKPGTSNLRLALNEYRDFCLTEFRVDAVLTATTNIALGCPAKATHPLWAGMSANLLNDGLPGSFIHPAESGHGLDFHFEIDLGSSRRIDHIALRGRADGFGLNRMSRVLVQLYDESPEPVWQAMDRPDGSHPEAGDIDVLRVAEQGTFQGRFVRISSDNPVDLSPQIAEVEVYESLTPKAISIKADGRPVAITNELEIPHGTAVLTATLAIPGAGLPEKLPLRWRLRGLHSDWLKAHELSVEVSRPPPGSYFLEAQVGHTDGEWDHSLLSLPIFVPTPFWQTPAFYWALGLAVLGAALLLIHILNRRRRARELAAWTYQTALVEERRRIARDMHDEVGGRLSQLALMQDLIIRQHPLPPEARHSLERLAVNTREAVDALDQVVWAVNPLNDTLAGLVEYLSYLATSYLTPLNVNCRLDVPFDWPEVEVRAQVRHEITLAFREALQNIAKHAAAETVTLSMRYEDSVFIIQLADDGRGLPDDSAGPGKEGLTNMQSRLAMIGGSCTVRRRPEGGTEVEMRAPLTPQPL